MKGAHRSRRPRERSEGGYARAGIALALVCSGCGYGPVHGARAPDRTFALSAGPIHVADAAAVVAFEAGARSELARQGALARCSPVADASCASIVLELLALDDAPIGISASADKAPIGVGSTMTASGRATIFSEKGREDLGDARASEAMATAPAAAADIFVRREAARRAARRLGERLVRRALGIPEPASD